jgi:16S rRNA (cytidine1402-2'-O)-methyltransferase
LSFYLAKFKFILDFVGKYWYSIIIMSKLYIVATPIGNLSDITSRALETLKNVDLILCEDTRVSRKLMDHYDIKTKLMSYHQHSSGAKVSLLLDKLRDGLDLALITDAGTPGISDPGNRLVSEVVKSLGSNCEIIPMPGACAAITALSISGLPTDSFLFLGFIPHKKGREKLFSRINDSAETIVFYESTHRIMKTLTRLSELLEKKRQVIVCRELTKKFETIYRGNLLEVINQLEGSTTKGEFVVVVSGKSK